MSQEATRDNQELVAQVESLKQQIADLQSSAALGELLSTTTHEFNNILTTIINYAKIGGRHKDQETRDKAFTKILAAGERAAKITHSVLGMARNRSQRFESTDLQSILEQSLLLLERELSKHRISIELEVEEVPEIWASGNQLQQVILNLLINARQAMPKGGPLRIGLRHNTEANAVELCVRDYGTGIPPEVLPKIFDSHFSTKSGPDESGKGGSGLGLAACREIIEKHQGKIRVESTVGKGTAFTIRLPIKAVEEVAAPAHQVFSATSS